MMFFRYVIRTFYIYNENRKIEGTKCNKTADNDSYASVRDTNLQSNNNANIQVIQNKKKKSY